MVSGIGPRDILEEFGVPVLSDLEGVGQNIEAC
jgi:GMC oxidoreductase